MAPSSVKGPAVLRKITGVDALAHAWPPIRGVAARTLLISGYRWTGAKGCRLAP